MADRLKLGHSCDVPSKANPEGQQLQLARPLVTDISDILQSKYSIK